MKSYIVVIPMRAGSKGCPGKNERIFLGKPLYEHTLDQARAAGIQKILITTDIDGISSDDTHQRTHIIPRPAHLARDETTMDEVLSAVVDNPLCDSNNILLLQVTSPLRTVGDIKKAMDLFETRRFDLVLSASSTDNHILKYGVGKGDEFLPVRSAEHCFMNRAELPPVFRPDGGIFIFKTSWFRATRTLAAGRIGFIESESKPTIDIDTEEDFEKAEAFIRRSAIR